jgi:MiaB/RimO family radical SAM methylthiotransferase
LKSKSFHIITLGCKVNQYESEALREAWLGAGLRELPAPDGADFVLINSCAVTARAVSDLRAAARRARRAAPSAQVLVTGCAAQALPDELRELPVDALVPRQAQSGLLHRFDAAWPGAAAPEASVFPPFAISDYARNRAVLKIQDGCSQHCAYCIVPQGRGPSVSRPWPAVLAEAGRLVRAGFREIVLSGVNLRQYGADLPQKSDFWELLLRLEAAFAPEFAANSPEQAPRLRFRISSLEPGQLGAKALDALGRSRLTAPQLHLSLQSGSPAVLRKMNRGHYDPSDPAGLAAFLRELRGLWPRFGLGADFIAGFPGESEAEFAETLRLSEALPLTYAHVFPYSRRPGTAAARLPGQLAREVKKERSARLRALVALKKQAFLRDQLGLERVWVVPEGGKPGRGVNEFYSDCRFIPASPAPIPPAARAGQEDRRLVPARPLGLEQDCLLVEKLSSGTM